MAIKYRGKTFPGYNKPIKSDKPGKKKMVLAKEGEKVRLVHFGDSSMQDYTQHGSKDRKKSYCARSGGIKGGDGKLSANYWSRKVLWSC
jgi:hypothetical protein